MTKPRNQGAAGGAILGIAWIAVVLWIGFAGFVKSREEAALMQRGQIAPGVILSAWEDAERGDAGKVWSWGATYRYQLPDGRVLEERASGTGRLTPELRDLIAPYPTNVVYLADDPHVSRIQIGEVDKAEVWLTRKAIKSLLFLGVFLTPGIWILVSGVRNRPGDSAPDGENEEKGDRQQATGEDTPVKRKRVGSARKGGKPVAVGKVRKPI